MTRPEPSVRVDPDNEWAWCGERRLDLTPRAFAVLRYLVEHPQRLITKDDLLATVWRDSIVSDAALASCIRDLRRALGDSSSAPRYIETVHRRGFRFIGPVAGATAAAASPGAAVTAPPAPAWDPATLASPPPASAMLVGRDAELARLHERLRSAVQGRRQLVFVTGEPGIGKTSLVEAFLARIGEGEGRRIGRGQCVEQYGSGEPYLPVLEALGRLGRAPGGEQVVEVLRRQAPSWLAQLPSLVADGDLEAVQHRTRGATRERMLRELVEALDVLTVQVPLVLLLEDLHWSDSATIDLLGMLARRRDAARLLVLGTYRPADLAAAGHPLISVKQELQLHGYCDEVTLDFLGAPAVGEYLGRRFPGHGFPSELAPVLHRNTDGNPLFLVNAIDHLIGQGLLRETGGQWGLSGPVDAVRVGQPDTLWQLVDVQLERLTADERAMLAVGSVAGAEFSAAIAEVRAVDPGDGELLCEGLARRGQFIRPAGVAEWPDGTVAARYAFIHALYQQVLYARVSAAERVGLHLRLGERLQRGFAQRAGEIAGELAMHFEQGRAFHLAVGYRRQAGEQALRKHAYREAADHAARALDQLRALPDSPERRPEELALQVMLGAALTTTRGYAAPEVARTYARARELCAELGDPPQLFPVLLGLGRFYLVRGEFGAARQLGAHLLAKAEATGDRSVSLAAHNALGIVAFYSGEFETALTHLEAGIALYDPEQHSPNRSPLFHLGQDPGVSCTTHSALTLWIKGYPDRAAERMEQGLALARSLEHPFSVSYACHFAVGFHQWRSDRRTAQELADTALALDTEHGFDLFLTAGAIQHGWLLSESGKGEEGLARMRAGVERHRRIGAEVLIPAFLALVAEACGKIGRPLEGLAAIEEALQAGRQSGQHYWEADLHRLRAELTLEAGTSGTIRTPPAAPPAREAEADLAEAIAIARRQGARSLELRAAISLGRLWARRGKSAEARALLSPIYGWFTEGFDTADLGQARALLRTL